MIEKVPTDGHICSFNDLHIKINEIIDVVNGQEKTEICSVEGNDESDNYICLFRLLFDWYSLPKNRRYWPFREEINRRINIVNAHEKKIGCEHEWALNETKTEIECSKCGTIQVL